MTEIRIQSRGRRIAWSRLNLLRAEYYEDRPELLPADSNWRDSRPTEPQGARPADILTRRQKSPWFDKLPGPSDTVRRENDGPTAEWLAERDAAGIATSHGREGNRIERALIGEKSPLVANLRQVAELLRPPVVAANDNPPPAADANPGQEGERVHNQGSILPSVPMLLRAYAPLIETSQRRRDGGWYLIGATDGRRKLSGLIFQDGKLIAYGDDRGRRCRPGYVADPLGLVVDKDSETAKHIERRPEENRAYTRMRGAGVYLSGQRTDAPSSLTPPPRTSRAVANDNSLAAARANTPVMPSVTRLPDGVAKDFGRLAGIADANGIGEGATSAPMQEALAEMDRAEKLAAAGFNGDDLEVVDAILDDASFRSIGLSRGYAESSAHKMGRKVVEDVLKRISAKIAA